MLAMSSSEFANFHQKYVQKIVNVNVNGEQNSENQIGEKPKLSLPGLEEAAVGTSGHGGRGRRQGVEHEVAAHRRDEGRRVRLRGGLGSVFRGIRTGYFRA